MKLKKLIPIACILLSGFLKAAVVPYNKDLTAHKDVEKSAFYKVEIKQNGTTYETFVNMAKANDVIDLNVGREKVLKDRTISWASFDFSGTVTVSVTVLNTQAVPVGNTIKLLPSQAGINTTKVGSDKVEFTLTNPDQLSLEIGTEGYKNGLVLFANPLETDVMSQEESDVFVCNPCNGIPSIPTTKTKVYFTDRVHDLGEWNIPSHVKEVYLQGNSAVMGKFNLVSMKGAIKIYGRGSLVNDKDEYQRKEQGLIKTLGSTNNVTIKDIVLVRREKLFGISLHGSGNLISNVKLIGGFNVNNDGIFVGKGNSLCENTFLMVNDDGLKTFTEDAVYKNTTMWVLTNGAAIQTGWSSKSADNVTVDGLYIIRAEWEKGGVNLNNGAILNSRLRDVVNGDNQLQTNIVIKNVYTEHAVHQFIRLDNDPIATHKIDGFELSNWNVTFLSGGQNIMAYTKGYIKNIKFNNFKVNGTCVSSLAEAKSKYNFITNASTTGLTFGCTTEQVPVPNIANLSLSSPSCTSVSLTWGDVSGEEAYRIRRKTATTNYITLADVPVNTISYLDETAEENTTYQYMVRPMKGGVAVATSNTPEIRTAICKPSDITDLVSTSTSCTSVSLNWSDVLREDGYRIRRKTATTAYVVLADVATNSTNYTDATAEENTTYQYMVSPLQGDVMAATSNTSEISTSICKPLDIKDLALSSPSCTSVNLTWSDVSSEEGYRIRRKTATTNYIILGDVPANTISYLDETAEENSTYQYMVRPVQGGVAVAISNTPEVSTEVCYIEPIPVDTYLKAYPNPTTGIITLPEVFAQDQIKIINSANGITVLTKTILQNGSFQLDITNQSAGNYVIQLIRNNQLLSRQIVKL